MSTNLHGGVDDDAADAEVVIHKYVKERNEDYAY